MLVSEWRRDVKHVVDAGNCCVPSAVRRQVRSRDRQPVARIDHRGHCGARYVPLLSTADRGAHLVPALQQLGDAPPADVPRTAGDQPSPGHGLHLPRSLRRLALRFKPTIHQTEDTPPILDKTGGMAATFCATTEGGVEGRPTSPSD